MLYICTNHETLFSGCKVGMNHVGTDEVIDREIENVLLDSGCDWQPSQEFRDWHGGRHDQFHERLGCVAWSRDASPREVETAKKVSDMIHNNIARLEEQEIAFAEQAKLEAEAE